MRDSKLTELQQKLDILEAKQKEQKEKLLRQLRKSQAKVAETKRKEETRRKILLGVLAVEALKRRDADAVQFVEWFHLRDYVEKMRPADREFLGLGIGGDA